MQQLFVLLLLILLSRVAMVTAVAGCHNDRDKDHRPRENCTGAGFSDIPAGLGATTKVLLFPKNLFTGLSWSSFQKFKDIYEIDLTGNQVPEVTPSVAPILRTLSVLRLGSNRLRSLSDGSFSACPALTELYLQNNVISSLTDRTFCRLSKLEILDLSSNHISVLPKLMLHPLTAIETLYVEYNKIKVMPDDWFSKKEEVPYLYLSSNPWACSCSLTYFHKYLNDYESNVYVRDGPNIRVDAESVVCDSPQQFKDKPVITLEESNLCSHSTPSSKKPFDIWFIDNTDFPTEQVVTWSWYQTFTSFTKWSTHSGPVGRGDGSLVESRVSNIYSTGTTVTPSTAVSTVTSSTAVSTVTPSADVPTVTPSADVPTVTPWAESPTKPVMTKTASSTIPSTTQTLWETTASFATEATIMSVPSLVINKAVGIKRRGEVKAFGAAAVFCFWLFAGCLVLCVASAACIVTTLGGLVIWYRRVYKPLSAMQARRMAGVNDRVTLSTFNKREERVESGGGVLALYRSVLYVHREEPEAGDKEREAERFKESLLVNLAPTAAGGGATEEEDGERGGKEERGVYRKTLFRVLSKEKEIEGWRDVVEECRISSEDGTRKGVKKEEGASGGGVSRKRYSVILREEREEAGGGREELDWVVGGWEVKRGAVVKEEEPRSSWGEWLAHYLPSMPWGVTTPPEDEATP